MARTPLRVLFLSSCVRGGGAGWSLYYLLKHLDRNVIEPLVVVPAAGIFEERFARIGARVRYAAFLPERTAQQRFRVSNPLSDAISYAVNLFDSGIFVAELASIIRKERIELVYANNMMVKPLGALAAQATRIPCVLHVRNLHDRLEEILLYCRTTGRLPAVKRIITNSHASAVPWLAAVPEKVRVVHNGIDFEEYAPDTVPRGELRRELSLGQDDVLVGFTGNLIERKGLKPLVRAAIRLVSAGSPATFLIFGKVPLGTSNAYVKGCETLIAEAGIADRFRFLGFTSDVRPAVADFDILVLPSLQEPFGRSIIEAMALGTPVVASRVGGIPEIIDDGDSGLLVPPLNDKALADAIGSLVDDTALRHRIAASASRKVRECFDVARLSGQIQGYILEAAKR